MYTMQETGYVHATEAGGGELYSSEKQAYNTIRTWLKHTVCSESQGIKLLPVY